MAIGEGEEQEAKRDCLISPYVPTIHARNIQMEPCSYPCKTTNHFLNYTFKWQETPTSQLQSLPLILWISGPVKVSQQCPKDGTVLPRVETQQL